jgi:hypothetical protein
MRLSQRLKEGNFVTKQTSGGRLFQASICFCSKYLRSASQKT